MLQQLTAGQLTFEMVLLEFVQQVFRETDKAELGELKAEISHLLQAIVIGKLAQTLKTYLAESSEAINDLDLFLRHFEMSLNNLLQGLLSFS